MKINQSIKQKLAETSEIPKDMLLGLPLLTILGELELVIENYSSIIEYTESVIRIRTKTGQIHIQGLNLRITYYTNTIKLTSQQ